MAEAKYVYSFLINTFMRPNLPAKDSTSTGSKQSHAALELSSTPFPYSWGLPGSLQCLHPVPEWHAAFFSNDLTSSAQTRQEGPALFDGCPAGEISNLL